LYVCHKALTKGGKLIIAEGVMDRQDNNSAKAIYKESLDLIMFSHLYHAKERTKEEYQDLLSAAGFTSSKVYMSPISFDFVVGHKG
jgi:hypothetical protein